MTQENLIQRIQNNFNISDYSASVIAECVDAYDDYKTLPIATTEDLQAICDVYNVMIDFNLYRDKMIVTGLSNTVVSSYLFTDKTLELRKTKPFKSVKVKHKSKEGILITNSSVFARIKKGSDNKLNGWYFLDHNDINSDNPYVEWQGPKQKTYNSKAA